MGSFDREAFSQKLTARFAVEVTQRLGSSAMAPAQRLQVAAIAKQALSETINALSQGAPDAARCLPVTRLKAADVIAQGRLDMSQASLYRAAEQGRFYAITPSGRNIGKVFPAWQFVEPVPELIAPILACLGEKTGAELQAFWVTAVDQFNELAPAELLAGLPFESRAALHPSQQELCRLPARIRQQKVAQFAAQQSEGTADVIG
jgi:hypothetical protein